MTDEPIFRDSPRSRQFRDLAVRYAWAALNIPYKWGGNDPMEGYDCSGLIVEVLTAVGILGHGSDYDAAGLYETFKAKTVDVPYRGCLVFYVRPSDGYFIHVGLCLDDCHVLQEAGGGSSTTDAQQAARQNAFAKIRPIDYRPERRVLVDPFKEL